MAAVSEITASEFRSQIIIKYSQNPAQFIKNIKLLNKEQKQIIHDTFNHFNIKTHEDHQFTTIITTLQQQEEIKDSAFAKIKSVFSKIPQDTSHLSATNLQQTIEGSQAYRDHQKHIKQTQNREQYPEDVAIMKEFTTWIQFNLERESYNKQIDMINRELQHPHLGERDIKDLQTQLIELKTKEQNEPSKCEQLFNTITSLPKASPARRLIMDPLRAVLLRYLDTDKARLQHLAVSLNHGVGGMRVAQRQRLINQILDNSKEFFGDLSEVDESTLVKSACKV